MQNHNRVSLTVDQLHLSDSNVRLHVSDEGMATLRASILSVGLFQPMVVTPRIVDGKKKKGEYEVLAGGRRWRVLKQLAEEFPERKSFTFDCVEISDPSKITEISLAENRARENMTTPEIYNAWAKIRAERPKATLEELGAMFGYDAARTARIMRLANLAPEIMALYIGGEIEDAQAMAYAATEDQRLQVAIHQQLEQKPQHQRGASAIRSAMNSGDKDMTRLLRYVGIAAYREAGGEFEADLFAKEEETGRVLHPDLLQSLAHQRVADDKDRFEHSISRNGRVLGEKWGLADLDFSWADQAPQKKEYGYLSADYELRISNPKRGKLADDLEGVISSLEARLAELIDEDDEPLSGHEDEHHRLSGELEELVEQRPYILPKKGAVVGVYTIDDQGGFSVQLWYASRAAKGIETPKGMKSAVKMPPSPAEAERARFGLSKDNMQLMMLIRRDMIREELAHSAQGGSSLALEWLLYTQARTILHPTPGYSSTIYYHGSAQGILDISNDEDGSGKLHDLAKHRPERAAWQERKDTMRKSGWADAADPVEGFILFRAEGETAKNEAAALIAGHMLMATTSAYSDGRTPRMVRELANYIEQEPGFGRWRDSVQIDEAFFEMFSHKARVNLLNQWGLEDRVKGLKSSETAAFCARIVNCDEADASLMGLHPDDVGEVVGWLPEFLETQAVEPLAMADEDGNGDDLPELAEDEGEMSEAA